MLKDRYSYIYLFIGLLACLMLYWPAYGFEFAWLDFSEIVERKAIGASWGEIMSFFLQGTQETAGNYRPFYNVMHSLDSALWNGNPRGFHLSSILLHLFNGILLLLLLKQFLKDQFLVFLIVLAWVVLPVNAASVALLSGKADVLYVFFFLLAANVYLFREEKMFSNIIASGLILCSLLSKEMAVALPLGLVALHVLKLYRLTKKEWIIIGVPTLLFLLLQLTFVDVDNLFGDNYLLRLLSFPMVYGSYFLESLPGFRLSMSDSVFAPTAQSVGNNIYYFGLFLVSVLIQVFIWKRFKPARPFIVIYNALLISVSQIIPTDHMRSDQFLYAPSIAWVGMVFVLVKQWASRYDSIANWSLLAASMIWGVVLFLYLPSFSGSSIIFNRTLEKFPENREALSYLGKDYLDNGNTKSAAFFLEQALNSDPLLFSHIDKKTTQWNMGNILLSQNDFYGAVAMFESVNKYDEILPKLYVNMGICYKNIGQKEKALEFLTLHQKDHPNDLLGMEKIAEVYIDMGYNQKAIDELNKILRLYPKHEYAANIKQAIIQLQQM